VVLCLVPIFSQAANPPHRLVPVIESNRLGAQQPTHPRHEVRLGRLDHHVKMITHQATGMHLEPCLLAGLRQGLEELLSSDIILEDLIPAIPAAHDACPAVAFGDRRLDSP